MKFINLLQKELKELVNAQMILSLAIIMAMLMLMGNFMKTAVNDINDEVNNPKVNISDCDDTEFTQNLIQAMKDSGATVNVYNTSGDDYAKILSSNDIKNIVIIPEGFTSAVENGEKPEILTVSRMTSAATMANLSTGNSGAVSLIRSTITSILAEEAGLSMEELEDMESPVLVSENTVVDDKSAAASSDTITGKITMQNMILPIVVFFLIMLTSQSLISSISNEKIDKTLETLLSAPVSRTSVITAKMLAAAIVALINAGAMMIGFSTFIKSATDEVTGEIVQTVTTQLSADDALKELGLTLSLFDYLLIGVQLFFTIMICLSVSIMLGALVNDTKSSQTVLFPIMFCAMIPYIISMFADINALPMTIRIIVYAIPFTHTFSGMSNLMFGNTTVFFGGLIYQIVVFLICMFFALRLFNSDKILTISLNFGQKSKFRKKNSAVSDDE